MELEIKEPQKGAQSAKGRSGSNSQIERRFGIGAMSSAPAIHVVPSFLRSFCAFLRLLSSCPFDPEPSTAQIRFFSDYRSVLPFDHALDDRETQTEASFVLRRLVQAYE